MQTLVAGGTGFVGTALVCELTARGHDVTVLARTPEDADLPSSVKRVACDLLEADTEDVREAVAGHDSVVNLVALSPLFTPSGGDEMHERLHLGGTEKLVAAAAAEGVTRFVQMSALGADPDGPTHYIRAKGRAEAVVRDSALEWTIVRPSVVFGDGGEFVHFTKLLTTPYVTGLPGGGKTRFQPIWVGDLAPMLADCVADPEHVGQTYELGGPEVLTLADVAAAIYTAAGKSLRIVPVPMPMAKLGLTLGGLIPGFPMGADQYRSLRFDNTVGGGDPEANEVRAFGVDPADLRTFESYLASDGGDAGTDNRTSGSRGGRDTDDGPQNSSDADDRVRADGGWTRGVRSLFVGRETLGLFTFLSLAWGLPAVVDIYSAPVFRLLFIPSYLVSMVVYDGFVGLENVTYAVQNAVPGEWAYAWDAGLVVTFYLFAVAAVLVGRLVRNRFGGRRLVESTASRP
jgi:uncharacterized protein YbjT (DUF2867 family)